MPVPSTSPSDSQLAAAIHNSGWQALLAITGGGSRAISTLLETPGASRSVIGAIVPYSPIALAHWLGGAPEQACSAATARAMAVTAFRVAHGFAGDHDPERVVGVACTASLATDRPKHGDHRIHVATHTSRATASLAIVLDKGRRDRAGEESLATCLMLRAFAAAAGVADLQKAGDSLELSSSEHLEIDRADASPAIAELWRGDRRKLIVPLSASTSAIESADAEPPLPLLFPGAFNPPHAGHLRMAEIAEQRLGQQLAWELSIVNVDKPMLDFIAIRDRLASLHGEDPRRAVLLTRAPTFREKSALFPGTVFVVGIDTLARIADARYYHEEEARRNEAIQEIAAGGCRFLVFGRQFEGRFQSLADLTLPAELRSLCDEIPSSEFREDVSSTQLRSRDGV